MAQRLTIMKASTIAILMMVFISSCDPIRILSTDGADVKMIHFPCGSVSIQTTKKQSPGYMIENEFVLSREVQLYFDSLNVKNSDTSFNHVVRGSNNKDRITQNVLSISDRETIYVDTNQDLYEDTLQVHMKGFIICDGTSVYTDEISIVVGPKGR